MRSWLLVIIVSISTRSSRCSNNNVEVCQGNDAKSCGGDPNLTASTGSKRAASKRIHDDLKENIAKIRSACGDVCDTTKTGPPGKFFDAIEKSVDCNALFENHEAIDAPSKFPTPPAKMPKHLREEFTYQSRVKLDYEYYDDATVEEGRRQWIETWDETLFDRYTAALKDGRLLGSYGKPVVDEIADLLRSEHMNVTGKHVLVIGSQSPWIEVILLEAGQAARITTLEYADINSEHPRVDTITPAAFARAYLDGSLPRFDAMITFSSLEHSGLGRYGDGLNPWGDLIAMSRTWCVLKPGARAMIGVPTAPNDQINFNAARIYGPLQYSHLFANWKQIHTSADLSLYDNRCVWCYQPLYIVEKP